MRYRVLAAVAALVLVGCGDPDPSAERGYTKAPLERPGLIVRAESPSAMAELAHPVPGIVGRDPAQGGGEGTPEG